MRDKAWHPDGHWLTAIRAVFVLPQLTVRVRGDEAGHFLLWPKYSNRISRPDSAVTEEVEYYFKWPLMFVPAVRIAGRMRDRAITLAYDSFCFAGSRSILEHRDQFYGGQPLEFEPSRRLRYSRAQSAAPPRPGHMGCGFKEPPASIK